MTRAAPRPLWLAAPSRYAGRSHRHARWLLAILAALLIVALASAGGTTSGAAGAGLKDQPSEVLAERVVEDIRHGSDYYSATARALRAADAPLHPFLAFRLPTLSIVQAQVSQSAAALLLYALALVTLFAWWKRLADALLGIRARSLAVLFATIGAAGALLGHLVVMHDLWAGLIVALSLAARRPGRWGTAAALGLSAALIRETAAIYLAIMMGMALLERQRREAIAWGAMLAIFAVALALHAQAVAAVVGPLDQSAADWAGAAGLGSAIQAIVSASGLALLPAIVGALVVALSIAGWSAWRDPLATRAFALIAVQLLLMSFLGGPEASHWAFLIAPIVPIGFAFFPDALRDLLRAALDRRRITVTRTAA